MTRGNFSNSFPSSPPPPITCQPLLRCWMRIEQVQQTCSEANMAWGPRRPFKFSKCALARWTRSIRISSIMRFHWHHGVLQHGHRIVQTHLDIQASHMQHARTRSSCARSTNGVHGETVMHNNVTRCLHAQMNIDFYWYRISHVGGQHDITWKRSTVRPRKKETHKSS